MGDIFAIRARVAAMTVGTKSALRIMRGMAFQAALPGRLGRYGAKQQ